MCCFFLILVFLGPRFGILFWWLVDQTRFQLAFDDRWFIAILAWLGIPWTTLMYLLVFPGGIEGFDWVWLGLGLLADIVNYTGGLYTNRQAIPGYDAPTTGNKMIAAYMPGGSGGSTTAVVESTTAAAPAVSAPAPEKPASPPPEAPPSSGGDSSDSGG